MHQPVPLCVCWGALKARPPGGSSESSCVRRLVYPNCGAGWGWWDLTLSGRHWAGEGCIKCFYVKQAQQCKRSVCTRTGRGCVMAEEMMAAHSGELHSGFWFKPHCLFEAVPSQPFPCLHCFPSSVSLQVYRWSRAFWMAAWRKAWAKRSGLVGNSLTHALLPWSFTSSSSPWCWSISISTPLLWSSTSLLPFHFSVFQFLSLPFNMPNQFWVECIKQKKNI